MQGTIIINFDGKEADFTCEGCNNHEALIILMDAANNLAGIVERECMEREAKARMN